MKSGKETDGKEVGDKMKLEESESKAAGAFKKLGRIKEKQKSPQVEFKPLMS
jgi:hypothetical protein